MQTNSGSKIELYAYFSGRQLCNKIRREKRDIENNFDRGFASFRQPLNGDFLVVLFCIWILSVYAKLFWQKI